MNKNIQQLALGSIFALACTLNLNAQVVSQKVGTNPTIITPSAAFEVESANKGVLFPRVALTAKNVAAPITAPATSLIVYNTATAGTAPNDVSPGFYYWDGAKWANIGAGGVSLITKRVACTGVLSQTITDPDVPATEPILVTYEDPSGNVISTKVTSRIANNSFVVDFAAVPPTTAYLNYAYPGAGIVVATGPQGPAGPAVVEVDAVIGNEITNVTTSMGLTRSGSGTTVAPYTVGLTPGTTTGEVMTWNGTAWVATAPTVTTAPWFNVATSTQATSNTQDIYQMGKVLVNTATVPTGGTNAKLIVNSATNGAVQIKDGTEGAGKVLTSDASGLATWKDAAGWSNFYLATSTSSSTFSSEAKVQFPTVTLPFKGRYLVIYSANLGLNGGGTVNYNYAYSVLAKLSGITAYSKIYNVTVPGSPTGTASFSQDYSFLISTSSVGESLEIFLTDLASSPETLDVAVPNRNLLQLVYLGQ